MNISHPEPRTYVVTVRGARGAPTDTDLKHIVRAYDARDAIEQAMLWEKRECTDYATPTDVRPYEPEAQT